MRFPSLFRLPRNQQFEIKPRYYDPVKEFVEERRALAKDREDLKEDDLPVERIRFDRRRSSQGMNTSLLQMIIALILAGGIVGWLYLGNQILYYSLVLIPVYLYFRFRRK